MKICNSFSICFFCSSDWGSRYFTIRLLHYGANVNKIQHFSFTCRRFLLKRIKTKRWRINVAVVYWFMSYWSCSMRLSVEPLELFSPFRMDILRDDEKHSFIMNGNFVPRRNTKQTYLITTYANAV